MTDSEEMNAERESGGHDHKYGIEKGKKGEHLPFTEHE